MERKHKNLLQIACSLMFQSHLPKKLWGDSILTTTYIINKLPNFILSSKTPYELFYDKLPYYNILKCFGCLYYVINTQPFKDKFSYRAFKCFFIGYVHGLKVYKAYDLHSHHIYISRDIVFYENIFPYHNIFPFVSNPSLPSIPIDVDTTDVLSISDSSIHSDSAISTSLPILISTSISTPFVLPPRQSTQVKRKPTWLNDFVSNIIDYATSSTNNASSIITLDPTSS